MNQELLDGATRDSLSRARRHQLTRFVNWLNARGQAWNTVDSGTIYDYERYLYDEHHLGLSSIKAHCSTVRAWLSANGRNIALQGTVYERLEIYYMDLELDEDVKPIDRIDWWSAQSLLGKPGKDTLRGLRDTALIAVLLSTGIRGIEATRLQVEDVNITLPDGSEAIRVRAADGREDRIVPRRVLPSLEGEGDFEFPDHIQDWLDAAKIVDGPVFRGFYKGEKRLRPGPITVRTVEQIVGKHRIEEDGWEFSVTPRMLRRTYAAHMYPDVSIRTLQEYLGVRSADVVLDYVGKEVINYEDRMKNLFGDADDIDIW